MKYKMIAVDMDGTLLNNNKEVSERAKLRIKEVTDLGVKFIVSTGRIFTSAKVYAELVGTRAPIIASNGAYIREKDKNEIIFEKILDKKKVKIITEMIKGYGFYPHLFTADTIYTEQLINISVNYSKWNEKLTEDQRVNVKVVENIESIIDENRILKVVVMTDELERLNALRREISDKIEASIVASYSNSFEVMEYGISKGSGVAALADYYGIKSEEVICIGDSENDMSMIQYAGLGIAMGNAAEYVKEIADYITDTNENDGVAKALEKFVLNK